MTSEMTVPEVSSLETEVPKGKRKQLTGPMEHMRSVVTEPEGALNDYGVPVFIQPIRKPRTDSSNNVEKRTDPFQFGSRFLEEGDDIFSHNAWDHVETDETYENFAQEQYQKQRDTPVSEVNRKRYNDQPEKWWNKFYANNTSNFFKDRKWLFQEFPILKEVSSAESAEAVVLEVGAGAGNTAFPLMNQNQNPHLTVHACDYSKKAIEVIKASPNFNSPEIQGKLEASVWDITSVDELPEGLKEESVDVVILIFIFSALEPSQWQQAIDNVWKVLKPGGTVLFRDYGRGDLAQVRFKKERWLAENFYARGDGTRVYFFAEDELKALWTDKFEVVDFGVDRRMLVNRQRRLKMFRCWLQARFQKPGNGNLAS
jgi:tRNAThr (cytosine32-N3)-methyltransferase